MTKLIGYARVSTRPQSMDRQEADLLAAGVRRDDQYFDQGVSGALASRPQFDRALGALEAGDVDTSTPMGSMLFTIMAALAQVEHEIKRERILDSISKRRDAGTNLGSVPAASPTSRFGVPCAWWKVGNRLRRLPVISGYFGRSSWASNVGLHP